MKTAYRAKTMTLDAATHTIYFSAAQFEPGTKNMVASTFAVYAYAMK